MIIEIMGGLGWLLASALSGVVGNRTDAGLRSAYKSIVEVLKKGGKPLNYDLQKAVQRSYLQAIQVICKECLDELKNRDTEKIADAALWLERKIESLELQLKEVENLEYKEASVEQFQEIELLLTPEGKLAEEKIRTFRIKIIDAVAEESGAPVLFRKKIKSSLFEYMCGFFASEINKNSKVRDIFVTHLLVNMDITLEGMGLTVERLEAALQEIAEAAHEVGKSFLTVEEIKKNSDFKPIFISNYKFVGRSNELNRLEEFLENELKIMAVIGEGGIGKTRLVIEFAKKIVEEGDWDVYFVNPDGNPHSNLNRLHGKKIMLILDEAGSCTDRDKLIDSVLNNYSKEMQIKLLLIVRPIFKNSIESYLKKKSVSIKSVFIEPKKGDIVRFLRENCTWITEDTARIINERSFGSFNAAIAIAEYYREKGNIADVEEALSWQAEKYIRDIAIGIGKNPDDIGVASTIRLISLITPVAWEEKEYLSKIPPYIYPIDSEALDKILQISSVNKGVLSYFPEKNRYEIKPDPLADHLRMELMKNEEAFTRIWKYLIPYMAYRISNNIAILPRDNSELLNQIWNELNIIKGLNEEYFKAIVFFTADLEQIVDINNISQWIKCYHDLPVSSQDKKVKYWLARSLYNAVHHYVSVQKFEQMETCLQELRELHIKHHDKEVRDWLARGLVNVAALYVEMHNIENIKKMESCLQELRELHRKNPDKEMREQLAMGLINAMGSYGMVPNIKKMESCLQELRDLYSNHSDKEVREQLAGGLNNALVSYGMMPPNIKKIDSCLQELRDLYSNHSDKEMRERFAVGLNNALISYGMVSNIKKMNSCLQELRELHRKNNDKIVREELASSLLNIAHYYGMVQMFEKMDSYLQELQELYIKHPDQEVREELAKGIVNALAVYGKAQMFEKLDSCLHELQKLYIKHPEKEMRAKLAMGLYNAAIPYESAQKIEKLESCLQELRELHIKHHDKEVREQLAKVLYNALIVFRRKCYDNLVLLYKLRFDLLDDPDRQKRNRLIEEMLIEETVKISESEYNKGAENFRVFLQKIKSELGNDTEVVLLMDKVAEKLPLKAQKVMFETYSY